MTRFHDWINNTAQVARTTHAPNHDAALVHFREDKAMIVAVALPSKAMKMIGSTWMAAAR